MDPKLGCAVQWPVVICEIKHQWSRHAEIKCWYWSCLILVKCNLTNTLWWLGKANNIPISKTLKSVTTLISMQIFPSPLSPYKTLHILHCSNFIFSLEKFYYSSNLQAGKRSHNYSVVPCEAVRLKPSRWQLFKPIRSLNKCFYETV